MEELARRHDLENERPLVAAELNRRYARQKIMLQGFIWLTVLLVVGIGFIILIERTRRIRQVSRIKERFAADLHDELGANLHTIGLLSDLSKELIHSPDKLSQAARPHPDLHRTQRHRRALLHQHARSQRYLRGPGRTR